MNFKQKDTLIAAVKKAGQTLLQDTNHRNASAKVTTFDFGIPQDKIAEQILIEAVQSLDLNAYIIAEESGKQGDSNAEYKVYIDPMDGSVNYSHNIPSFCVGVGVYKNDQPLVGIVYDPSNEQLFLAEVGKGIYINNKKFDPPIAPAKEQNILINLEWFGAPEFLAISKRLYDAGIRARSAGSGVLALLYGTIGRGDGTILLANKPWDVAPGLVFATELGLTCTNLRGGPINLSQEKLDVIVASSYVHQKIISAIE